MRMSVPVLEGKARTQRHHRYGAGVAQVPRLSFETAEFLA